MIYLSLISLLSLIVVIVFEPEHSRCARYSSGKEMSYFMDGTV